MPLLSPDTGGMKSSHPAAIPEELDELEELEEEELLELLLELEELLELELLLLLELGLPDDELLELELDEELSPPQAESRAMALLTTKPVTARWPNRLVLSKTINFS